MTAYVADINTATPDGSADLIAQGDDEIRAFKAAVLNSFPKITSEVSASSSDINKLVGLAGGILSDAGDTASGTYIFTGIVNLNGDVSVSGGAVFKGTARFEADVTVSATLVSTTYFKGAKGAISGTFTFASAVKIATPTSNNHAATKGYVDAAVVAGADPTTVDIKEFKHARVKLFYYGGD